VLGLMWKLERDK